MFKAVVRFLFPDREGVTPTYYDELNFQSSRVLLPAALISIFAWLNYIKIDRVLHPTPELVIPLRYGLSVAGLVIFLAALLPFMRKRSMVLLWILGLYLQAATGALTGLAGADSAYMGGYIFVLMMVIVVPVKRWMSWTVLWSSLTIFAVALSYHGADLKDMRSQYALTDLATAAFFGTLFIYVLDRLRWRSWEKTRLIAVQNSELAADRTRIERLVVEAREAVVQGERAAQELRESGRELYSALSEQSAMFFTSRRKGDDLRESLRGLKRETSDRLNGFASSKDLIETIRADLGRTAANGRAASEEAENILRLSENCFVRIESSRALISELKQESGQIEEISQTINDIADQTSLLALNASIESARAGEYGRGFAVVADAISRLSERSISSAREIGEIVSRSVMRISSASEETSSTAAALRDIVGFVEKNRDLLRNFETMAGKQEGEVSALLEYLDSSLEFTRRIDAHAARNTQEVDASVEMILKIEEFYGNLAHMADRYLKIAEGLYDNMARMKLALETSPA